jgi:hypothetical protein
MLKENPQKRPNIYEVVKEVCDMQKKEVPIRDVRSAYVTPIARLNILTDGNLDLLQSVGLRSATESGIATYANGSTCGGCYILPTHAGDRDYSRDRTHAKRPARKASFVCT